MKKETDISILIFYIVAIYLTLLRIKRSNIAMDCTGPCLKHCYNKNTVLALIIGIFIGFLLSEILKKSGHFNSEKG